MYYVAYHIFICAENKHKLINKRQAKLFGFYFSFVKHMNGGRPAYPYIHRAANSPRWIS